MADAHVSAVLVQYREHHDGPVSDDVFVDGRTASIDQLGHLYVYDGGRNGDDIGKRTLGVFAAGVWLSWHLEMTTVTPPEPAEAAAVLTLTPRSTTSDDPCANGALCPSRHAGLTVDGPKSVVSISTGACRCIRVA